MRYAYRHKYIYKHQDGYIQTQVHTYIKCTLCELVDSTAIVNVKRINCEFRIRKMDGKNL